MVIKSENKQNNKCDFLSPLSETFLSVEAGVGKFTKLSI